MITLIAAVSENGVIGNRGKIPWRIPEDMSRFRNLTVGHPVIMGRKTYEWLPERFRPLPMRKNIVLSRTMGYLDGIHVARNIGEAIGMTERKDSYIMGGEQVYGLFRPYAGRMEITRVHDVFEGDAFFPEIAFCWWDLVKKVDGISKSGGINYSFLTYERDQFMPLP
jgi:dihydrofolate reductase